jgi:Tol biopolymer transport system component
MSLLPGTYTAAISGLAFNCDLTTAPAASADVILATTTPVDVRASCTPYLRNTIVYTSEQFGLPEVMVMRPDGSRRERLTNNQVAYAAPVVSPDGQTIAVMTYIGGSWSGIYLLDRFGKGLTKLVGHSNFDGTPAWSPDGTKLAFRSSLPGPYGDYGRIFIINRDGTGLRQLTPEVAATDYKYDDGASWSPDGTRLVFSRSGELFLINADGTGLVSTGVTGGYPAWSPDGTQIAYAGVNGGIEALFAMDMSFSPRLLTTPIQGDQWARWSPDGLQIVFHRVESNVSHIYKMGADGTGVTKLSDVPQSESGPSWSRNF